MAEKQESLCTAKLFAKLFHKIFRQIDLDRACINYKIYNYEICHCHTLCFTTTRPPHIQEMVTPSVTKLQVNQCTWLRRARQREKAREAYEGTQQEAEEKVG